MASSSLLSPQILWLGSTPKSIRKLIHSYTIKQCSWENLNQIQNTGLDLVFLSVGQKDLSYDAHKLKRILKTCKQFVWFHMGCERQLNGGWMELAQSFPPDLVFSGPDSVRDFLARYVKTNDFIRSQINSDFNIQIKERCLKDSINVLDGYEHPLFLFRADGHLLFKNAAAHHLLKKVLFPRSLRDLGAVGSFTLQIGQKKHPIRLDRVCRKHIFDLVFSTNDTEHRVYVKRLTRGLYGPTYLLCLKDRFKFAVEKKSSIFLDSQVVIQSIFHELRSPVTSIGLNIDALSMQDLPLDLKEDLSYCESAYNRLKSLTSELPQFFSWEYKSPRLKQERLSPLIEDVLIVMHLQSKLKRPEKKTLRYVKRILKTLGEKSYIVCSRKTFFQAFQELLHFLNEFRNQKEEPVSYSLHPFIKSQRIYLDLIVYHNISFFQTFAQSLPDQDSESIHVRSLEVRDAIKHVYFVRIHDMFDAAGFKLWVLRREDEMVFRIEHTPQIRETVEKEKPLVQQAISTL